MKRLVAKLFRSRPSPIARAEEPTCIGDYSIVRKLGSGGTSDVYLGVHKQTLATAAIKLMSKRSGAEVHRQMFANEARLCGQMHHPHVVALHGSGLHEAEVAYLVMEYVEGCSLDHHDLPATLLPLNKVIEVMRQAAEGLRHLAEESVIHRDIKPGNILLRKDGRVKLSDFGCAMLHGEVHASLRVAGSLPYMAPEQIEGKPLTTQADMYSLGCVFYRLLSGRDPIPASVDESSEEYARRLLVQYPKPLEQVRAGLSPAIVRFIERAMHKRPEQRFDSWQSFLLALQRAADGHLDDARSEYIAPWYGLELFRRRERESRRYALSFGFEWPSDHPV